MVVWKGKNPPTLEADSTARPELQTEQTTQLFVTLTMLNSSPPAKYVSSSGMSKGFQTHPFLSHFLEHKRSYLMQVGIWLEQLPLPPWKMLQQEELVWLACWLWLSQAWPIPGLWKLAREQKRGRKSDKFRKISDADY